MRIFNLITLVFSICILSFSAYAEEGTAIAQETKPKNIFADASNEQIKEAKLFYKRCLSNETLSKKKDCKCAATSFLETRINLGDAATITQIMDENKNKCLKEEKDKTTSKSNFSNITNAQLDEAQAAYQRCKNDTRISTNYDCECFGARYLDKRLELGPIPSYDVIFLSLKNECRNVVDTTGKEYSDCMVETRSLITGKYLPKGIEAKYYCECYARKWGELFEAYKGNLNSSARNSIRMSSNAFCKDPSAYK